MITREQLYKLVWAEPASSLSARLGVSDSYINRVCIALMVPRPPRGYWARRAAGQQPAVPELPPLLPGNPDRWSRSRSDQIQIKPFYSGPVAQRRRDPAILDHPLVSAARPLFEAAAAADVVVSREHLEQDDAADAMVVAATYLMLPKRHSVIDITSTRAAMDATLNLASTLYYALESRGHRVLIAGSFESFGRQSVGRDVVISGRPNSSLTNSGLRRPTIVYVGSVPVGIAVMEAAREMKVHYAGYGLFLSEKQWKKHRRAGYSWSTTRWVPTGLLKIVVYSPSPDLPWRYEWTETRKGQLAKQAKAIAAELEKLALCVAGPGRG